jgi:hypothetical protein
LGNVWEYRQFKYQERERCNKGSESLRATDGKTGYDVTAAGVSNVKHAVLI